MPDELFDVINEQDQVVGQEMRSIVHQRGLWHRGAHVLLFSADDKLIVQQRSRNKSQSPLALDCSVSEHVTAGEDYLQAATRGLSEELGMTNIELTPIVKFKMNYGPNDNEISMIFKGIADLASVLFDPEEIERVGAYSIEELQIIMEQKPENFSYWFGQITLWLLDKPSALQVMNNGNEKYLMPNSGI
ncbi:MAG TPA: NUDIX hydrolase [Anaerolineae bacterium]|nr:NUDIX hydrolase [Anaerolineae bacterium]